MKFDGQEMICKKEKMSDPNWLKCLTQVFPNWLKSVWQVSSIEKFLSNRKFSICILNIFILQMFRYVPEPTVKSNHLPITPLTGN
jgi:hypothetical protein